MLLVESFNVTYLRALAIIGELWLPYIYLYTSVEGGRVLRDSDE